MRVGGDGHVFEDLSFVPDVVARRDDVGAEIEELVRNGWCNAEASSGVFAVDDKEIDGVGFKDVRQMFADDVAAGGAKDIADKKDIHWKILHGRSKNFALSHNRVEKNRQWLGIGLG